MTASDGPRIHPVILSGGAGTRLWPMSRKGRPKQFIDLLGDGSLFGATLGRVDDATQFAAPIVVCNASHDPDVTEGLAAGGFTDATVVLEPAGRNTAPAVAVAALLIAERDPAGLMLVMPSDHLIPDVEMFRAAVADGADAARAGRLVLFGIPPVMPETGYGYIEAGPPVSRAVRAVQRFVEKPARDVAMEFVKSGRHFWNSGIFLMHAATVLAEFERFAPEVLLEARASLAGSERHGARIALDPVPFARCPAISVDYAIMEHTAAAAVMPATFRWSDVGSWDAVAAAVHLAPDAVGSTVAVDAQGCYVRSSGGRLIALVGVHDVIVVDTPDALLIVRRGASQSVKEVVESLRLRGMESVLD